MWSKTGALLLLVATLSSCSTVAPMLADAILPDGGGVEVKANVSKGDAEGEESGRVMAICLHPYLYGQPHRVKYLDRALGYILGHEGVWQATGSEIAQWSREHWFPQLESHLVKFAREANDA